MSKVPDQAKRVFKGVIFDVYQWPQKLYDGSTETFEMLKRSDTALVVPVATDGQILLVEDEQPQRGKIITFPGGRVNAGEEPLAAAKRELMEETGYSSERWELWYSTGYSEKIDSTAYYFVARDIKKTGSQKLDSGEIISARLVGFDQLLDGIITGEHNAYALGTHIMQQLLQDKRAELKKFLTKS
ncbi:MAG TPA: NUDIX hydrolase [Candidatus Saccharimonadales bacterium]|nr:NUDIX hydrolase [Candidatus Saccharimonadales bacterium]